LTFSGKVGDTVSDERLLSALMSRTRRMILDILARKEATAEELANETGKSIQTIYYHLRVLEKAGLISHKEERHGHLIQKRYVRRGETRIFLSVESRDKLEEIIKDAIKFIQGLGMKIRDEELLKKRIAYILSLVDGFMGKEKEVAFRYKRQLEEADQLVEKLVLDILAIYSLSDKEFSRYIKLLEEFRRVVRENISK
jgi:DNA-binding transcriptional ArsR family regulator